MTSQETLNCAKLRDAFEGREAIYFEKGVIRVRVSNIRWSIGARAIHAEVEEVPTPGMPRVLFARMQPAETGPLRWTIVAGHLTTCSADTWEMGYGGWSLYFTPEFVDDLTAMASAWPTELDAWERYSRANRFLLERGACSERSERVFLD
jgi:hypothetical protein